MKTQETRKRIWKIAAAAVVILAVIATISVTAYGTLNKDHAADAIHEEGHGHGQHEVAQEHEADQHDAVVADEHEVHSNGTLEITLNAVEGRHWRFEPGVIEAHVGQRVKLTLVNEGHVEHDVEIPEVPAADIEVAGGAGPHERLGGGHHGEDVIAAHAEPGTTATVTFTLTEAGEYDFSCTIPGHKEAGMVGKLVVKEWEL